MGVYMPVIGQVFIDQSRSYLSSQYLPRIRRCVQVITDEDLWWRPNARSNSIGNLLLHLAGNVRQWIVTGIGGESDTRERQKEFDADRERSREELIEMLESTLGEVDRVLAQLKPEGLLERRVIQGREVSVLEALYHVVEHFGMHTGQIVYVAKLRTSTDLQFYDVEAGIARPKW
jgi:uncharacterized damage-inducible protein DinB